MAALALVRTTVETKEQADALAARLIAEKVACCVHTWKITSRYRWDDAVQADDEWFLEARVPPGDVEVLREAVLADHPYDVPLLEVLHASGVPGGYAEWARDMTR